MPLPARYIDAGLATDTGRRVAVFPADEWYGASEEELSLLRDLPLHENQEYMLQRDLLSNAVRVVWRYQVPVITSLRS